MVHSLATTLYAYAAQPIDINQRSLWRDNIGILDEEWER